MTPAELAKRLAAPDPPHLLDVRQPDEFTIVALPGAKLIPLHELPERVGELAAWREREVVVYCHQANTCRLVHRLIWQSVKLSCKPVGCPVFLSRLPKRRIRIQ